ncbi:MAG TPA: hypothetical protein VLM89_09585 [Phycisphaerae bacterium]|nr:hypothetical protein [Phycisphaerae bacterium]
MKHKHGKTKTRWKAAGLAALFLGAGVLLLILSSVVIRPFQQPAPSADQAAASAPAATAPASQPATPSNQTGKTEPTEKDHREASAENFRGLLILMGLISLGFGVICVGWIVYDIYRSRPAWKTQTKYPRRR